MRRKADTYDNILHTLSNKLRKAMFSYEEIYNYDELCTEAKKRPLKRSRIILFFTLFFSMFFIYMGIIKLNPSNLFTSIMIVFSLLIISLFITILVTRHSIKSLAYKENKVIYFYKNFFVIVNNKKIVKFPYKKLSYARENKQSFVIVVNSINMKLEKNKLDKQAIDFLKNMISNYKKIEMDLDYEQGIWNLLDNEMNDSVVACSNEIDTIRVEQYYSLQKVKLEVFIHYYLIHLISSMIAIFILLFPLHYYSVSSIKIIYWVVSVPCLVFILDLTNIKKYLKINIDETLTKENQIKLFFFENFLLLKTQDEIIKYEYNDLSLLMDNSQSIFMKIKSFSIPFGTKLSYKPLIIDKNKLNDSEIKFIYRELNK